MTRPIGYYVHHHGDGHRQRAVAIAAHDPGRIVLLGTGLMGRTGGADVVDLPDDRMPEKASFDGIDDVVSRPLALHYAPLNHDGVRARMAQIAQWISDTQPALMVVDVSVEVAMLARLLATPVAYVRLNGRRDDAAHMEAYRAASALIAPFAQQLDDSSLPQWVRDKTIYCPGIVAPCLRSVQRVGSRVLVVQGKGGECFDGERAVAAALATPKWSWRVIGPATAPDRRPGNLEFAGWIDDAAAEIAAADIVVGAAGDGLMNSVISIGRPFVCIPQRRPFDEQVYTARALKAASAAVVLDDWPDPGRWPDVLDEVARLDLAKLAALGDNHGAAKMLDVIQSLAESQK